MAEEENRIFLSEIKLQGTSGFNPNFFAPFLDTLINNPLTNLDSMYSALDSAQKQLSRVFRQIDFYIEPYDGETVDGCVPVQVVAVCQQKKPRISCGASVSSSGLELFNVSGMGDRLSASVESSTCNPSVFHLDYWRLLGKELTLESGLYKSVGAQYAGKNWKDEFLGSKVGLRYGKHLLSAVADWRLISGFTPLTSAAVRREAGHSVKAGLIYSFEYSSLNHVTVPTSGNRLNVSVESAIVQGSSNFAKITCGWLGAVPLTQSLSLLLHARGGLIQSANGSVGLMDRFFAGGPTSVRGSIRGSVGPRDRNDSIGCNSFIETSARLQLKLNQFLSGHLFVDTGNSKLSSSPIAYNSGVGLVGSFLANARIELNVAFQQFKSPCVQIGVAMEAF